MGVSKLMDLLSDSREIIRNDVRVRASQRPKNPRSRSIVTTSIYCPFYSPYLHPSFTKSLSYNYCVVITTSSFPSSQSTTLVHPHPTLITDTHLLLSLCTTFNTSDAGPFSLRDCFYWSSLLKAMRLFRYQPPNTQIRILIATKWHVCQKSGQIFRNQYVYGERESSFS